jgi:hypothetical protein
MAVLMLVMIHPSRSRDEAEGPELASVTAVASDWYSAKLLAALFSTDSRSNLNVHD